MTQSELNILKSFYRKFNLNKDELTELKHYLAAPVSKKEQKELYDQLIHELDSSKEKDEIPECLGIYGAGGQKGGG